MTTISYHWKVGNDYLMNNGITDGDQNEPAICAFGNGGYWGAWTNPGPVVRDIFGRIVRADGSPSGLQFQINSTTGNSQYQTSLAAVGNDAVVAVFTDTLADPGGDIRLRPMLRDGTPLGNDGAVDASAANDSHPDIAFGRIGSQGYRVIVWERDKGSGDIDVRMQFAEGTGHTHYISVNTNTALKTSAPSVAALAADGGIVVVWEQSPAAGGDSEAWFRRYDASGNALGTAKLIDTIGSINKDVQAVGLQDGGFAVAYTDNGWGIDGTEVSLKLYNADGTGRTGFIRVNTPTDGDQDNPSLALLDNGFVVVSFVDEPTSTVRFQAFDSTGAAIGTNDEMWGTALQAEIAALPGGEMAAVWTSTLGIGDTDGTSIRTGHSALIRTTAGGGSGEIITGDALRDIIDGAAGGDTLDGAGANDELTGGLGLDTMTGGLGRDRFIYFDTAESGTSEVTADVVADFSGKDTIDLHKIDANDTTGGNQAFAFIGTGAFSAAAQVRVFQSGADTIVALNIDADVEAEMLIRLMGVTATGLVAADFNL